MCSKATVLTKAALSAKMQLAFCFHCTLSKQQKRDTFCNNKDQTSKREKREKEREQDKKSGCLSKLIHCAAEDRDIIIFVPRTFRNWQKVSDRRVYEGGRKLTGKHQVGFLWYWWVQQRENNTRKYSWSFGGSPVNMLRLLRSTVIKP